MLVIAEDYETLQHINAIWPGHAVLMPPVLEAHAGHKFGSQVSTAKADPPKCLMK
jgi:rhamnogalacturonan II specific xylosyltransferase